MMEVFVLAILAVITAMMARRFWWLTRIRSWSMYPTLHHGDWVPSQRLSGSEPIRRGDVVVVASAELGRPVVKRVIGLPGEIVEVGARGVTIDGVDLLEPYVAAHGGPTGSFRVPTDAYIVLGDNRSRSSDSRSWAIPFVPAMAIRGRLTGRPLNRLQRQEAQAVGNPEMPLHNQHGITCP